MNDEADHCDTLKTDKNNAFNLMVSNIFTGFKIQYFK